MFPDLFSIGFLTIHTYGLFVALGFIAGLLVTVRMGKSHDVNTQQIMDMGFVMILWAIVGSRLAYVLMNLSYYSSNPLEALKIWQGGLVFSGGLALVMIAMGWYLRRHNLSFWDTGDLWAPGIALGQAVGRVGCFMAGCCYGKPTNGPWGVVFDHPDSLAPLNVALHPTQLYSAVSGLAVFLILMYLHARRKFEGQVLIWFLILHSTARLFIERFRGDDRGLFPGTTMSVTQVVALLILFAAVAMLLYRKRPEKDNPNKAG